MFWLLFNRSETTSTSSLLVSLASLEAAREETGGGAFSPQAPSSRSWRKSWDFMHSGENQYLAIVAHNVISGHWSLNWKKAIDYFFTGCAVTRSWRLPSLPRGETCAAISLTGPGFCATHCVQSSYQAWRLVSKPVGIGRVLVHPEWPCLQQVIKLLSSHL